jgi:GT2 family glycosyltransferase
VEALRAAAATTAIRSEIIVVDNGTHPPPAMGDDDFVRVLHEPVPGASRARNAGIAAASGAVIGFVDDDVFVDPGWVDAILEPFTDPTVVAVAGRVRLETEAERPDWLRSDFEGWYSAVDHGPRGKSIGPGMAGWTANLAVRTEAARAINGFDPRLGPGRRQRYNEDTEFIQRLRDVGTIWYAPAASARHHIGEERLTRRWLLRRTFLQGCSDAMIRREPNRNHVLAPKKVVNAVGRRWLTTARQAMSPATRDGALLRDGMWRMRQLGFVWERCRASVTDRREHVR